MIRERRSREYIDNYSTCVRVVKKLSWPFSRRWDSFFWRARGGSFFKRLVVIHRIDGRVIDRAVEKAVNFSRHARWWIERRVFDNSARALTFRANVWINRRGYIKGRGLKGRFFRSKTSELRIFIFETRSISLARVNKIWMATRKCLSMERIRAISFEDSLEDVSLSGILKRKGGGKEGKENRFGSTQ